MSDPSMASETPPLGEPILIRVGCSIRERRIDKYLHGRFSQFSRRFFQRAIKTHHVKVDGNAVKQSYKLNHGELIELVLPKPEPTEITPEAIPLDILFEDEDLIILNKPVDIVVHPTRGIRHGTLVNALVHHCAHLSTGLGDYRPGIVHRLDRNTTGVMIVTKNDEAQWKVAKQFEHRQVEKTYLAIVHGTPQLTADCINAPLGVHPKFREKYAVRTDLDQGKPSTTFFEVLEPFRGYSLMKMMPKTGRTHQIRVHLAHINHPIVADDTYGGKLVYPWQLQDGEPAAQDPIINRCALHAFQIEFTHPRSQETVRYEAPLPKDMETVIELLRQHRAH